jgi:hypothetical protein
MSLFIFLLLTGGCAALETSRMMSAVPISAAAAAGAVHMPACSDTLDLTDPAADQQYAKHLAER